MIRNSPSDADHGRVPDPVTERPRLSTGPPQKFQWGWLSRLFGVSQPALTGIAFAAWTLAAFTIGAPAGVLIRKVVPAIAVGMAAWAGLLLATVLYLRRLAGLAR